MPLDRLAAAVDGRWIKIDEIITAALKDDLTKDLADVLPLEADDGGDFLRIGSLTRTPVGTPDERTGAVTHRFQATTLLPFEIELTEDLSVQQLEHSELGELEQLARSARIAERKVLLRHLVAGSQCLPASRHRDELKTASTSAAGFVVANDEVAATARRALGDRAEVDVFVVDGIPLTEQKPVLVLPTRRPRVIRHSDFTLTWSRVAAEEAIVRFTLTGRYRFVNLAQP